MVILGQNKLYVWFLLHGEKNRDGRLGNCFIL